MNTMDFTTMSDEALNKLVDDAMFERNRRRELARTFENTPEIGGMYLESIGRGQGEQWVQPIGSHDAYPKDWKVEHNGSEWISTVDANVWEPGVSGWGKVAAEGDLPEWLAPSGQHDAYAAGSIVTNDGNAWRSVVDANVWEPGTPGVWEDLGPVGEYAVDSGEEGEAA